MSFAFWFSFGLTCYPNTLLRPSYVLLLTRNYPKHDDMLVFSLYPPYWGSTLSDSVSWTSS